MESPHTPRLNGQDPSSRRRELLSRGPQGTTAIHDRLGRAHLMQPNRGEPVVPSERIDSVHARARHPADVLLAILGHEARRAVSGA